MRPSAPDTSSTFVQRLGYYALGIALGLMILGWFQIQKMRTRQMNGSAPTSQVEGGEAPDPSQTPSP